MATLIFEVELICINPPEPTAAKVTAPQQPVTSDIIKVPSAEELKKGAPALPHWREGLSACLELLGSGP